MLPLLNQDIGTLVEDAELIRQIYRQIKGQLPADAESKIALAAFIESHQPQVSQARRRLSDREAQDALIKAREDSKVHANELKLKMKGLEDGRSSIEANIALLQDKKRALEQELLATSAAITTEQEKLATFPETLNKTKEEMRAHVRNALRLHKSIKPIPGSADEDHHVIQEIDQIRLQAIAVINDLLG
ncbi:unnamed protein product [Urochloa humidicola]